MSQATELAAWLVRFDMDSQTKISRACALAGKTRLDRLLVQVRGRADAWYRSDFVPRAEELEPGFDPLAAVMTECAATPLEAWLNVYYLWTGDTSPTDHRHPARQREWLLQDDQGINLADYSPLMLQQQWVEGSYADPASPAYRRYFNNVVRELLAKYPVRAIHLDFIRYPGPRFGTGSSLARRFRQRYGFDPRWLPASLGRPTLAAWANGSLSPGSESLVTGRLLWDFMRAAEVSRLVEQVAKTVHGQPGRTLSAALFPDPLTALLDKGQDWLDWLARGLLDEAFIMLYFGDKDRLRGQLTALRGLTNAQMRPRIWLGLGGYIKPAIDIGAEACLCQEFGFHRFALFSLGHLQRKKDGLSPFARQCALARANQQQSGQPDQLYLLIKEFQQLVQQSNATAQPLLRQRMKNFQRQLPRIQATISAITHEKQQEPFWFTSRGIFRYLDHYDSLTRGEEQLRSIHQARARLLAGEDFNQVSRELSQAGSRASGGLLPREYSVTRPAWCRLPGSISPVLFSDNGFWVKQLISFGGGRTITGHHLPWPARRLLLGRAMAETDRF